MFGNISSTTAPTGFGFSLTSTAPVSGTTQSSAPQAFSFGAPAQVASSALAPTTTAPVFGFGSGGLFGSVKPTSSGPAVFSQPAGPASAPQTFSFGSTTPASLFAPAKTTAASGLTSGFFGNVSSTAPTGFGFTLAGSAPVSGAAPIFGSTPLSGAAPISGITQTSAPQPFSFGAPVQAQAVPSAFAPTTTSSTFGFAASGGLLGSASTTSSGPAAFSLPSSIVAPVSTTLQIPAPQTFAFGAPTSAPFLTSAKTTAPSGLTSIGGLFGNAVTTPSSGSTLFSLPTATVTPVVPAVAQIPSTQVTAVGATALSTFLTSVKTTAAPVLTTSEPTSKISSTASTGFGFTAATATGTAPVFSTTQTSAHRALSFGTPLQATLPLPAVATTTTTASTGLAAIQKPTEPIVQPAVQEKPLTYEKLEELINKWTLDIEEQERLFFAQAEQINAWDRILMENGDKILELNDCINNLEGEHLKVDHQLDFVTQQQSELSQILDQLEKVVYEDKEATGGQFVGFYGAAQREEMIQEQVMLDSQLKSIGQELEQITDKVDCMTRGSVAEDPMKQVAQVLAKQMDALQIISQQTSEMTNKLDSVKNDLELRRKQKSPFSTTGRYS